MKPCLVLVVDDVDFGAIVEQVSDAAKSSSAVWSVAHLDHTLYFDLKNPKYPFVPASCSVMIKRDTHRKKQYHVTIAYFGKTVTPAEILLPKMQSTYTLAQLRDSLPPLLRQLASLQVCTGVFVKDNKDRYTSLLAAFKSGNKSVFLDQKSGQPQTTVQATPIVHDNEVYDVTFRSVDCARVITAPGGFMCQGCTKLARTLGQREMRYGLQHLDTNKQDLGSISAIKEKEAVLREASFEEYLSVAQPKFFAYLDEHPLFKEWFFDMLYRAPISCSRRPWPINVLRFSLVLSSTSSMACRLLRSIGFTLPGKSTIRKNRKKFAVEPGVNLDRIKRMVAELQWHLPELRAKYKDETEEQRHDLLHTVVLVADEVQDVPEVVVDRTTLKVTGLINHGPGVYTGERENQEVPAKHTLQLMCVSLGASKAIPVAHFDSRDMNTPEFVSMVSKAVVALNLAGLKVIAIGADGGSVNRAGFKVLGEPDNWPDGIPCPLLFQDIPHLLKRFRNVLLNHGILKKGDNVMSWFSIEALYEKSEKHPGLRLIQRLIKDALHPDAWSKMRVPLARAVMCEKTAYGVENYSEHPDGAATAEFIRQVDTLYTIMTDTVPFTKDSLIKGGKDDRLDRLQAVLKYFEDWKVDMEDKVAKIRADMSLTDETRLAAVKAAKAGFITMETYTDMKLTITSFTQLVTKLLDRFPFMRIYPRSFSTNCLESYFALVRAFGHCSTKVTTRQMQLAAVSYQLVGHLRSFMSELKTNYDIVTKMDQDEKTVGRRTSVQGLNLTPVSAPASADVDGSVSGVDMTSEQVADGELAAMVDCVEEAVEESAISELVHLLLTGTGSEKDESRIVELVRKIGAEESDVDDEEM